jgi:hypothetical protein
MTIVMWKTVIRAFLVMLTHLRAIEVRLGLPEAVEAIDPEILFLYEELHK